MRFPNLRFPQHLLPSSMIRHEPYMAAMAIVAVSMFVGAWVIGPLFTRGDETPAVSSPKPERMSLEQMMARPDPSPYRAATPAFDTAGAPNYAAAAKEKAQSETADDADIPEQTASTSRGSSRYYRSFDRHRIY